MTRRNRIKTRPQRSKAWQSQARESDITTVKQATPTNHGISIDMAQRDRILHADRIWTGVGR